MLLVLRVPLAFCLAIPTLLTIYLSGRPAMLIVERMYSALDYFPLWPSPSSSWPAS
jgi:hypothetical protein